MQHCTLLASDLNCGVKYHIGNINTPAHATQATVHRHRNYISGGSGLSKMPYVCKDYIPTYLSFKINIQPKTFLKMAGSHNTVRLFSLLQDYKAHSLMSLTLPFFMLSEFSACWQSLNGCFGQITETQRLRLNSKSQF